MDGIGLASHRTGWLGWLCRIGIFKKKVALIETVGGDTGGFNSKFSVDLEIFSAQ